MVKILIFLYSLFVSINATATWQLEPHIALSNGTFKTTDIRTGVESDLSGTTTVNSLGMKFGYLTVDGIFIGIRGSSSMSGSLKLGGFDSNMNPVADYSIRHTSSSVELGYYFPSFARIFAGTTLSDEMILQNDVEEIKLSGGSMMHIGVGLMLFSNIALDFEYRIPTFKKYSTPSQEAVDIETQLRGMSQPSMAVVLSFPVQF